MHPNIKEIFLKFLHDCPDRLKSSRLFITIKPKQDGESSKKVKDTKVVKYFLRPLQDSIRVNKSNPFATEKPITKYDNPVNVKMTCWRGLNVLIPKKTISLRAHYLKISLQYSDTKLKNDLSDFKNYLFSSKSKTLD